MPYARLKRALQRLPIRARLTLQYTLSLAAAILFFAVLVSALLYWNVARMIDHELALDAAQLKTLPALAAGGQAFEQNTIDALTEAISPDSLAQIVSLNGQAIAWTGPRPFQVSEETLAQALAGQPTYETIERREQWLRTYTIPLKQDGQVVGFLWLARSLRALGETLDLLQIMLTLAGFLTLGLAAFSGWRLARNALTPVDKAAQVALDISRSPALERRVDYDGPPDEIGRMIYAFNEVLDSLQTERSQTERALAAQRRFVSDASHELRTPLTSLRGNVGVLRRALNPQGETAETLGDMDDELARMSRLVNNLLALARADSAPAQPQTRLNLSELTARICHQKKPTPGINLRAEIVDNAWILGDADGITQLLYILLDNAFSYTPPPGEVVVGLQLQGESVILSARDSGMGIHPEDIPRIFERFCRGQNARQAKNDGSGLGLAIAQAISIQHNARLEVTSKMGEGSCFTVTFPSPR